MLFIYPGLAPPATSTDIRTPNSLPHQMLWWSYGISFNQKVAHHFKDILSQTSFLHVAHVTCIAECKPTYMGYVFEERSSAYIPRAIMLAIENQSYCLDRRKPWNDGPSYQAVDTCQCRRTIPSDKQYQHHISVRKLELCCALPRDRTASTIFSFRPITCTEVRNVARLGDRNLHCSIYCLVVFHIVD